MRCAVHCLRCAGNFPSGELRNLLARIPTAGKTILVVAFSLSSNLCVKLVHGLAACGVDTHGLVLVDPGLLTSIPLCVSCWSRAGGGGRWEGEEPPPNKPTPNCAQTGFSRPTSLPHQVPSFTHNFRCLTKSRPLHITFAATKSRPLHITFAAQVRPPVRSGFDPALHRHFFDGRVAHPRAH